MIEVQMHPEEQIAIASSTMASRYQFACLATEVMIERCAPFGHWGDVFIERVRKYRESTNIKDILAHVTWMRHCVKSCYHEKSEERTIACVAEMEWRIIYDDMKLDEEPPAVG